MWGQKSLVKTNRMGAKSVAALAFLLVVAQVAVPPPANAESEDAHLTVEQLAAFAPHFVQVNIYFKHSEEEAPETPGFGAWMDEGGLFGRKYAGYLESKKPMKLIGVVVQPDQVLLNDTIIDDEYLDRIEVVDAAGNKSPAERSGLFVHAPALALRLLEPQALKVRPVAFEEHTASLASQKALPLVKCSAQATTLQLSAGMAPRVVEIAPTGQVRALFVSAPYNPLQGFEEQGFSMMLGLEMTGGPEATRGPAIVLSPDHKPIGLSFGQNLPAAQTEPPLWRGQELLSDDQIDFATFNERKTQLEEQYQGALFEIKVTFRQETKKQNADPFGLGLDMGDMPWMDGEVPTEAYYYGLPVSPNLVFIPKRIDREWAKRIDTITVDLGETKPKGSFVGMYKEMAAFLVYVDEQLPTDRVQIAYDESLERFAPLFTIRAARRLGGKKLKLGYTRAMRQTRGYGDILENIMLGEQPIGTFYTDMAGRPHAALIEQREEEEETEALGSAPWANMYSDMMSFVRIYEMRELQGHLTQPLTHMDRTIVALSEEEQHRRLWLGVEYEPMSDELAETLGVEKPTKDGSIGLVVSAIYPDSPAQRLGLQSGDILLSLEKEGQRRPTELHSMPDYGFDYDFSDFDIPDGMDLGFDLPAQRSWKSRNNVITKLLEVFGEGNDVTLAYVTGDGEKTTTTFKAERAPSDFDSAAKYKSESLGLTVKEVTYEVRHALQLTDDANPVVVSNVEEGEPAAIAKVNDYDLITKVNDTNITGLDTFKSVIEAAAQQKDQGNPVKLRLTLQRMGKTRIADITWE